MADTAPVVAGDAWVQWKVEKRKSAQPFDFEEWYSLLEDVTPRYDLTPVQTVQQFWSQITSFKLKLALSFLVCVERSVHVWMHECVFSVSIKLWPMRTC